MDFGFGDNVVEFKGLFVVEFDVVNVSEFRVVGLGVLLAEEVEVRVEGDEVHSSGQFDFSLDVVFVGVEDDISDDVIIDGNSDEVVELSGLGSVLDFSDFSGLTLADELSGGVADVEGEGVGVVFDEQVLLRVGGVVNLGVVAQLEEVDDSGEFGLEGEHGGVSAGSQSEVGSEELLDGEGHVGDFAVEGNALGLAFAVSV